MIGAKDHAQAQYLTRFRKHLTDTEYSRACYEIEHDTIAARYLRPARDGREEWLVYAGGRWTRAIWCPTSKVIVTFKTLTERAVRKLKRTFA